MSRSDPPYCSITAEGVILSLHVQPRASKNEICGQQGDELKIRLTSPPVEGAANKLCREYLGKLFGLPKSALEIISGESSRHKRVLIHGDPQHLKAIIDGFTSG